MALDPIHIKAGAAMGARVGVNTTTTVVTAVAVQPKALVPVTEYEFVRVGVMADPFTILFAQV